MKNKMKIGTKVQFHSHKLNKLINGTITRTNKRTVLVELINKKPEVIEKEVEKDGKKVKEKETIMVDVPKIIKKTYKSLKLVEGNNK